MSDTNGTIACTFVGHHWLPMGVGYSDRRKARRWARRSGGRFIVQRSRTQPRYVCLVGVDAFLAAFPPGTLSIDSYYYQPINGQECALVDRH